MSLASAGALLWLVPLGAVLIALYLLKMRRRDLRVPATFLWPEIMYEVRANSLFQKLRFNWLLVLQLLALLLVVFGLARPQMRQEGTVGAATVLVVDTSASMSATDVAPSRLAEAVRRAEGFIAAVKAGDRLSLIEAGPTPRVVFPLSNDAGKMRAAIGSIVGTDVETDVGEAMRLAASIAAKQDGSRIVLLSDGVFEEVENFASGKASVEFVKIGASGENLAISALGTTETESGVLGLAAVRNFGAKTTEGTLNLVVDGKPIDSVPIQIEPGKTLSHRFSPPLGAAVVEAELVTDDVLASDNYSATTLRSGSLRVLLVTPGDYFLERALALDPRVTLDKSTSVPTDSVYDVVVFDGISEQPVRARGVLTFGSAGATSPVTTTGNVKEPALRSQEEHPLLRGVSIDKTYIESAQKATAKPGAQVLAQSSAGDLIVASKGAVRQVYVGFKPQNSDFPLQIGFPIFLSNALDFLAPRETGSDSLVMPAGRTFSIPTGGATALSLSGPSGNLKLDPLGGSFVVRNLTRVGEYRLRTEGLDRRVFTILQSETESSLAPRDRVSLGARPVAAQTSAVGLADFWKSLLLLALAALAVEWLVFARRS